MLLFFILKTYFKDVKKYGKEKLAVSLVERLCRYFALIGIPIISLIVYILYRSIH